VYKQGLRTIILPVWDIHLLLGLIMDFQYFEAM